MDCLLARTAAELCDDLREPCAWMACHFSAYGTGLSNLPRYLPSGSILIVNDRTPIRGHDPALICDQLRQLTEEFSLQGVLLDLQRPGNPQSQALGALLADALSCPVAVTAQYAQNLNCPVFLDPPPLDTSLEAYLAPWAGRELWLEAAICNQVLTITEAGCENSGLLPWEAGEYPHEAPALFCCYRIAPEQCRALFTFSRSRSHLRSLLKAAEGLGVTRAVGLYQQLQGFTMDD